MLTWLLSTCTDFILCTPFIATSCNLQIPLLEYDGIEHYYDIFSDERISATSHSPYHPPSEARMSGDGWCAESMCTVGSEKQYLQVDFGAEVVVEAISIDSVNESFYVTEYYVEYASDESQFHCVATVSGENVSFNSTIITCMCMVIHVRSYVVT